MISRTRRAAEPTARSRSQEHETLSIVYEYDVWIGQYGELNLKH